MYLKASTIVAAGILAVAGTPLALHLASGTSTHGTTASWIKTLHGGGGATHGAAATSHRATDQNAGATLPSTTDLTGKWNVTITSDQGTIESVLTLQQKGNKLTGTFTNPHGDGEFPVTGERTDDKIALAVDGKTDHGEMHLEITGEIRKEDGTLAGTMTSAMGESKCVAKRVKT